MNFSLFSGVHPRVIGGSGGVPDAARRSLTAVVRYVWLAQCWILGRLTPQLSSVIEGCTPLNSEEFMRRAVYHNVYVLNFFL